MLIVPEHPKFSVRRQCELLGISRAGFYYKPVAVDPEDLLLMRLLDEEYTRMPFYGVRKMTAWHGKVQEVQAPFYTKLARQERPLPYVRNQNQTRKSLSNLDRYGNPSAKRLLCEVYGDNLAPGAP